MQCNSIKKYRKLSDEEIFIQLHKEFDHRMFCYYPITSPETKKLREDIHKRIEELRTAGLEIENG